MKLFNFKWNTFRARFASKLASARPLTRIRWAIWDHAKFQALINEVKEFIDSLNQFVPVAREIVDDIVIRDLAQMTLVEDIPKLRLIERATEGSYNLWAEKAATIIEQSEVGTLDHRNLQEVEDDNTGIGISNNNAVSATSQSATAHNFVLPHAAKLCFVVTDKCWNPCDTRNIGRVVFNTPWPQIVGFASRTGEYNLGKQISDIVNMVGVTHIDQNKLWEYDLEWHEKYFGVQKPALALIYCPPCICQIQTALGITRASNISNLLQFRIRVDCSLESSCCAAADSVAALRSLLDAIEECDDELARSLEEHFDRPWLTRRLYDLEDLDDLQSSQVRRFASDYGHPGSTNPPLAVVIVLSELEYMINMMNAPPFPRLPKMPRAREIHLMHTGGSVIKPRTFLGTYTASNRAKREEPKTRMTSTTSRDAPNLNLDSDQVSRKLARTADSVSD